MKMNYKNCNTTVLVDMVHPLNYTCIFQNISKTVGVRTQGITIKFITNDYYNSTDLLNFLFCHLHKEMCDAEVKREVSIPPFMTITGSLEIVKYVLADFDNITIQFYSLAKAIDVCFKTYYLFNLQFSERCEAMWGFSTRNHYNIKYALPKNTPPTLMLLNEVKGK